MQKRQLKAYYTITINHKALIKIAELQIQIDKDAAKATLDSAANSARDTTYYYSRTQTFARIGELEAEQEAVFRDSADFQRYKSSYLYASSQALCKIAELYVQANKASAKATLDSALQIAKNLPDAFYKSQALVHIAEIQAKVDKDAAKNTLDSALQTAKAGATEFTRLETLAVITGLETRVDKDAAKNTFNDAIQIPKGASDIPNDWYKVGSGTDAFAMIAKYQAEAGDFDGAIKTAESVAQGPDKSNALAEIAVLQAKVDKDAAKNTFNDAIQIAKDIAEDFQRFRSPR